jgi:hypothetical protein
VARTDKEQLLDSLERLNVRLAERGAVPDLTVEEARTYSTRDLRLIIAESQHRLAVIINTRGRA